MYVTVALVRAIADELQRQGVPPTSLFARGVITPAELAETGLRLPIDRYDRIVRAARALSTTPALGLRVGSYAPPAALHVVGFIVVTCATIREAFDEFLRYSRLVKEGARWQMVEERDEARFVYDHDAIAADNAAFDAEAALALALTIGRQFIGPDNGPTRVCFRHHAPPYEEEYRRAFRSEVRFGHGANEMVFPRRFLDLEQAHRDPPLRALLVRRAEEMLVQRGSTSAFVDRLRTLLRLEVESGDLRVRRVAERMGLTVRSLERQARDRGVSLPALMEEARREAALRALRSPEAPIKDVAYRLGFSEPSAFHRAFKRWTGMTPAQYRDRAASEE